MEKPYRASWWGCYHTIEAKLLPKSFSRGGFLLAVQPLNTRPQYYVCQVDNKWRDRSLWDTEDFHELIERLQYAIEDCFSYVDIEDDEGNRLGDDEVNSGWPVADFIVGCTWWAFKQSYGTYRKRVL